MPNRKARLAKGSYEGLRKVLINRRLQNKSSRRAVAGVVLALFFSAGTLWAQVTASITGKVRDTSGAVVPGAAVTIKHIETGATRTAETDASGNYNAPSLPVGQYEVSAEKAGFKQAVRRGITVVVAKQAVVNIALEVGNVQQQVTVTAESPVVNTTTASVSGLVGEKEVKELPLNGRSFDNLLTLNPGAINYRLKAAADAGTGEGAYFTVAGRRPLENLFLVNGIEYTGSSVLGNTPGGVSGQLLGIDAVREFNVVSDTYGAEYGKRAGAQVSIVTQSGTNQLHGSAFEFLRNDKLDARNFFDKGGIPPFRRNQFGGSLGGPIKHDKMFLFGSYEGFRQRLGLSKVAFVPDDNARRGLLPIGPDNSLIQVPNQDPRMLPFFALFPQANGPNLGGGIATFSSNPKQSIREDFGTARFDYNISDKDTFTASGTGDDGVNLTPQTNSFFGVLPRLRSLVISAQETHVFSPQLLNTVRAGFSRAAFTNAPAALVPLPPNLSFFAGKSPGPLVIGAGTVLAASSITPAGPPQTVPSFNFRNLFSGSDDVQFIRGRHQLSLGGWFQRVQVNVNSAPSQLGQASFSSLQTFLQGTTTNFSGSPNTTNQQWRSTEGAWYVQDNMQLRPNLSIRVGVRHEFTNGWNEKNGKGAQFIADSNGVFQTQTRMGEAVFTQNNARKLFSPRVGVAWDPFGKGKTSVRAGFSMHYTLLDNLAFMLNGNPPFNGVISNLNVSLPPLLPVVPGTPGPPQCGPGVPAPCTRFRVQGIQGNAKTPTILEWNYSIEQQLTPDMSLRVGYVGSHGYHQIQVIDPQAILSQTCSDPAGCLAGGIISPAQAALVPQGTQFIPLGTRRNPFLGTGFFWATRGVSFYNALQVDLKKRFSSGLTFRANYTYSKNMDDTSTLASSQSQNSPQTPLDQGDPLRDYSRSNLDFTHQASVNFSYELPFGRGKPFGNGLSGVADKLVSGWQLNGVITALSGFAFTPQVGSNRSGSGDIFNPDRPNINPDFRGSVQPKRVEQFFNPAAFSLPTIGTLGSVGRNALEGPNQTAFDFSVFKSIPIPIREGARLEFRTEFFNIANRANFSLPNSIVFSGGQINPSGGRITDTATSSRQIQFGLKLFY